jgi:hypothetical protein
VGGTSCYKLIVDRFMNWQQAADYCLSLDLSEEPHILNIDSAAKQMMIEQLIKTLLPGKL